MTDGVPLLGPESSFTFASRAVIANPGDAQTSPGAFVGVTCCPRCGTAGNFSNAHHEQVIRCDDCQAILAYGVLQPRIVIQPPSDADPRFVDVFVDKATAQALLDGKPMRLEKGFGALLADNIDSLCAPGRRRG